MVKAQYLKSGNVLKNTKEIVISVAVSGVTIPTGKVELVLENSTTNMRRKVYWNKSTSISVIEK